MAWAQFILFGGLLAGPQVRVILMSHAIFIVAYKGTGRRKKRYMPITNLSFALNQPIKELPFTETFIHGCKLMGFDNIQEIVELTQKELAATKGFDYIWYNELLDYLRKNNLLYLVEG